VVFTDPRRAGRGDNHDYQETDMITISAFADEISPDLSAQMDVCEANGVKCIDVRGIDNTNVSKMTLDQVGRYKKQMDDRGFRVPCIGSPIGKVRLDEDFAAHLDLLKHCMEVARAFGTNLIRVFSFYPPEGKNIKDHRSEVMDRMAAMVRLAEQNDIILLHENESAIYGWDVEGVKDLFATVRSDHLRGVFDPANFVVEGLRPYDQAWQGGLGDLTFYLHIKDRKADENVFVPAGQGGGQFQEIFADLARRGWSGTATLEPHLSQAGQFYGFTGPEGFGKAASALKALCEQNHLEYQ